MAYITDTTSSFGASVLNAVSTAAHSFANFFADISVASSRMHFIEELQAMDDDTLFTKHGIKRSEIVAYVFHDKMAF